VAETKPDSTVRSVQAGVLSWIVPGAGHYLLGHRGLAIVFFVAVTFPYVTGLALGGILDSVNPRTNKWLFLSELGVGGYTVPCALMSQRIELYAASHESVNRADFMSFYPGSEVAIIYLATAGLLNLLVILDAISRAQTGGLPTFHRDPAPGETAGGSS
jgi:hypothetical protein